MQDGWDDESYAPAQEISEASDRKLALVALVLAAVLFVSIYVFGS